MRDLKDFSASEWLRGTPLVHGYRQLYTDVVQALFTRKRPAALDGFLRDTANLKGQNITLVVAFEQPWVLGWLIRMGKRHLLDSQLLVFDNSRRTELRADLERVCREQGIPYLALPHNFSRHPNRSHGMALNWIYRNVVRAIQPRRFGFIDHDLIPMADVKVAELLGSQVFYGAPNFSDPAWNLWAGFCFFDYAAVEGFALNFLYDFSRGLDTGGRNWPRLYSRHPREQIRFAERRAATIADPAGGDALTMEIVDKRWLHLCGVSYNNQFNPRAEFFARISAAVDAGASLGQIEQTTTTGGA